MPFPTNPNNQNNQNNHHPKPFQYNSHANPLIEPQAHLIALPACPVASCHQLTLWGFLAGLTGQLIGVISEPFPEIAMGLCIPVLGLLLYLFWFVCHDSEWRLAAILRFIVVILGLVIGA